MIYLCFLTFVFDHAEYCIELDYSNFIRMIFIPFCIYHCQIYIYVCNISYIIAVHVSACVCVVEITKLGVGETNVIFIVHLHITMN